MKAIDPNFQRPSLLWCIDPLHDDVSFHKHAIEVLVPLAESFDARITPLWYVDYSDLNAQEAGAPRRHETLYQRINSITELIPAERRNVVALIHSIPGERPSLSDKVKAIAERAKGERARLVAVHTHGWLGLSRRLQGGFAESLLLTGAAPVLFIGPSCNAPLAVKRLVFAADLQRDSLTGFRRAIYLCRETKCELLIVHYLHHPSHSVFLSAEESDTRFKARECRRRAFCERNGRRLANLARAHGVKASFILREYRGPRDLSGRLVTAASELSADLVCLAERAGPLKAAALGPGSAAIAQRSTSPVLLFRA